jgi:FAD/FMN-containing dehydrogenase
VKPRSLEELAEALRGPGPFSPRGTRSKERFLRPTPDGTTDIDLTALTGIVEHHPQDQVVVVRAGTRIDELQRELAESGQALPLAWPPDLFPDAEPLFAGLPGTLGGGLSTNLPHALEGATGSWRDWVLGMTVVRPDGTIAKCGSQAVKNVAGYDVQRLFIGARGTLAVVAEVILRTISLPAIPMPSLIRGPSPPEEADWIQRTLRTDFRHALDALGERLVGGDEETATLWAAVGDESPARFPSDWVLHRDAEIESPILRGLMKRTKEILDPRRKLNPGSMGNAVEP